MPIHTLSELRGRGRGRGRGYGRGRGKARGRGHETAPEQWAPFSGGGKTLLSSETGAGQHQADGAVQSVFEDQQQNAVASYEDFIRAKQEELNEVIIDALMQKIEQERNQPPPPVAAQPANSRKHARTAASKPPVTDQQQAQSNDVVDLCDSDEERPPLKQQKQQQTMTQKAASVKFAGTDQLAGDLRVLGIQAHLERARQEAALVHSKPDDFSGSGGATGGANPFLDPPRYIPPDGENVQDLLIRTNEIVEVLDTGLVPHRARAILDTGNEGGTLICAAFAKQLGLVDWRGKPTQSGCRKSTVRGVVAGASEQVDIINITYCLRGITLHVKAGINFATLGCDLLVSRKEILRFESEGFRFTSRR